MNPTWLTFLAALAPDSTPDAEKALFPLTNFSVLNVSGNDAATFLQGQLTCNINDLRQDNSFFAALCNPKGRVISTFLIFKQGDDFLLLLPTVLIAKVQNTLQKYILRAKVRLADVSAEWCVSGLACDAEVARHLDLPAQNFSIRHGWLKLPTLHYVRIASVDDSLQKWNLLLKQGFIAQSAAQWTQASIQAGLAWLDETSSEAYIPQMLNLDTLGGLSLTKGCYTGQEIVARTHYLGQNKRALFQARCGLGTVLAAQETIVDNLRQPVGKVLTVYSAATDCQMLVVLQVSAADSELRLTTTDTRIELV